MMKTARLDMAPLLPIAGLLALFVALARGLVNQQPDPLSYVLAGFGLVCSIGFLILRVKTLRLDRLLRRGIRLALLLGILAAINLAAAHLFLRLDLTELRGYSLAPQTLDALARVKEPVTVTAFLRPTDYRSQLADKLLGEYADHSPWVTYRVVDPDVQPSLMQQKGVTRHGTLVFERGARIEQINSVDEQSITSTLMRLSDERRPTISFTTGHGERDIEAPGRDGYSTIKWYLENNGYEAKAVTLGASDVLTDGISAMVVASPRDAFSAKDRELLAGFLTGGGRLLVLLDAGTANPFPDLMADWGVEVVDNLVFDPFSSFFGEAATPLVNEFGASSMTRPLQGTNTFFPLAREVRPAPAVPQGLQVNSVIQTSSQSWGEMNLADPEAGFDPAVDHLGPVSLAVTSQATLAAGRGASAARARLVVFGDSDFVSNAALSSTEENSGNALLFKNAVNWALEDDALIRLTTISAEARRLVLTGQQMRLIAYASILFAPLAVVFAGVVVWWRRRAA